MFLVMCRRGDAQLRQKRTRIFFLAQCFVSLRFQKRDLAAVTGDFFFKLRALFLQLLTLCVCRCDLSFGVMGAHYQPMGHVQVATNLVDYGMDVQAAIDGPRAFFAGDQSVIERGLPPATAAGLKARGHDVAVAGPPWGGAQAIRIDWQRGVLIGGSDPRKDGCALGY